MTRWGLVGTISCALTFGVLTACSSGPAYEANASGSTLYEGFDTYSRPIGIVRGGARAGEAQRWFDQGMVMVYGFNHEEAIRSFEEAAARDPKSPMPYWGIAHASGININDPAMDEEDWRRADAAASRAMRLIGRASPQEAALIRAARARYTFPPPEDMRQLNEAYAREMESAFRGFPDDPDIATLYAESLLNLQPWDYWERDGAPKGRIVDAIAAIERALEVDPSHPGALHFHIHAVEASRTPERAESSADRLLARVPGSGHLVHMPSHIYARVGRYADAAESNEMAVEADRAYFEHAPRPGYYYLYYAHNLHFLAYAAMMEANSGVAIRAARDLEAEIPEDVLRRMAFLIEGVTPSVLHVMVRFGMWEEILREPEPADFRLVSRAVRHYARGIAHAAMGDAASAREEQRLFESSASAIPPEWWIFANKVENVLPIARNLLEGEILYREGRRDEAFAALRRAIEHEDALTYDEPPGWMLPVRHSLGALLLDAGLSRDAEEVYREDLARNPNNGWSLVGLQQALAAQGRPDEAQAINDRLMAAWPRADVMPSSSCYCAPGVGG